ncbi:hypothetical protein ACTJKN_07220 [Pedobacter sp. 22163]|uniref:hypothetical protein n=1 Tax=Pedobacter sp. 22163 TaxID=3453883 RepID=UPI003F855DB9
MNNKKLTKRVQFVFKRKPIMNLTKEQMRQIYGGDTTGTTAGLSTEPTCVENKPTVGTVSN